MYPRNYMIRSFALAYPFTAAVTPLSPAEEVRVQGVYR